MEKLLVQMTFTRECCELSDKGIKLISHTMKAWERDKAETRG